MSGHPAAVPTPPASPAAVLVRVRISGVVQGVGFRPFVHHLATELGLSGLVGNDAHGVFAEATGPVPAVDAFLRRLVGDAPALAVVERVEVTAREPAVAPPGRSATFRIVASPGAQARASAATAENSGDAGDAGDAGNSGDLGDAVGLVTSIPPDTAVCPDCLAELRDPADRRFGYPFIACTSCGPRYTIVTGLPYDRDNTTMVDFPLCGPCRAEYEDPTSRRFHAQPTACPDCGPRLSRPVADVVAALRAGAIVAIKGVGGYHLACDARNVAAVARLRARKQRGDKPFAVMVAGLDLAGRIARLDPDAEALLATPARPIVLADSRDRALQQSVAPGNSFVGVMLPYVPLHHLLFDAGAPEVLVMTSGNLSDEPICTDPAEAEDRLAGIADVFCHHDRRIHVACDDSVVRIVAGRPQPVRRSRGYAPLPISLPISAPPLVAVGGELKATVGVALRRRAWLSQHIGDTENLQTLDLLARTVDTLTGLQRIQPEAVVSDAHPGYLSHVWAGRSAARLGVAHLVVQHHHAHMAALLAEHGIPEDRPVLGIVFDGTGYGTDATIWGGEMLLGGYGRVTRVGHLRPTLLPGGDAAIRFPARTALAHLTAAGLDAAGTAAADVLGAAGVRTIGRMLATGSHCTPTTSAGRLFDAVASLLDVRHRVDYEAQAAIELEALAASAASGGYRGGRGAGASAADSGGGVGADWPAAPVGAGPDGCLVIDPGPWIGQAVADHAAGRPAGDSARAFHRALAAAVAAAAQRVRDERGVTLVGLTGGVFANAILTADCLDALLPAGFTVLTHRVVPPNDGGLALGQLAVAAAGGAWAVG